MSLTFDPLSLPPWRSSTLRAAFQKSFSLQQIMGSQSQGFRARTPREDMLESLLNVAIRLDSGEAGPMPVFLAQDLSESMNVAFLVLGEARLAPDAEASFGGGGKDFAEEVTRPLQPEGWQPRAPAPAEVGPLLPVAFLVTSRSQGSSAVMASATIVSRKLQEHRGISIKASTAELPLLVAMLRESTGRVSASARAAFEQQHPGWSLGFIGVPTPAEEVIVHPELHGSFKLACSGVGCVVDDAKLRCGGCTGAVYCSQACQRSDWKVHKKVCARKDKIAAAPHPALPSTAPAAASGSPAQAAVPPPRLDHTELVDLSRSDAGGAFVSSLSWTGGATTSMRTDGGAPIHTHGAARFIVKVQLGLRTDGSAGLGAVDAKMPMMVYDAGRALMAWVAPARAPALFAAVPRANWDARRIKAYFWARREGDWLRVFLNEAVPRGKCDW